MLPVSMLLKACSVGMTGAWIVGKRDKQRGTASNSNQRKGGGPLTVIPRMEKRSKLRTLANGQLPKRLRKHNTERERAFVQAKRPHPPRRVQQDRKLAAKIAEKERLAKLRPTIAKKFGLSAA